MPHTLAATLTGTATLMGILLTLICKPLAMPLRTLSLTNTTLTSPPVIIAAWAGVDVPAPKLRIAAANGSASQDLNEACMVFLRLTVSLGPSLHFYVQDRREPAPARGDEYAGAWPTIGHSIKRLCFLLVPTTG